MSQIIEPLISYCVLAYNQQEFIEESVISVLEQDYPCLEIIISDDNSTDSTFLIIEEIVKRYKGRHKVILNKNESNLGIGAHFSKVANTLANGDYMTILGGDDIAKSNHVSTSVTKLINTPGVNMIDCSADIIDTKSNFVKGIDLDFVERLYSLEDFLKLEKSFFFAPGRMFSKKIIKDFPLIDKKCPSEDYPLIFRGLLNGGILRINEPLILYRIHENNTSSAAGLNKIAHEDIIGQLIKDLASFHNAGNMSRIILINVLRRVLYELEYRHLVYSENYKKLSYFNMKVKAIYLKYKYLIFR